MENSLLTHDNPWIWICLYKLIERNINIGTLNRDKTIFQLHKLSSRKRHTWPDFPIRENTSNILFENGPSLNILITIKIIALTNIILIETTVLLVYLLLCYLIFNFPLLCTSCGNLKFACHRYITSYNFPQMTTFNRIFPLTKRICI